jgi:hypothetical protein
VSVISTRLGLTNEVLGELDMAALQGINSAEVLYAAPSDASRVGWTDQRFNVGVSQVSGSVSERFWSTIARGVLRYKACSPVARWLLPRLAALSGVVLYWIVRLAPYWIKR